MPQPQRLCQRAVLIFQSLVVGDSFVGREDVLRRLEALWAVEGQRPSVVLYGHRRMGKSSILQNLKGEQFGPNTRIVDFNLQKFGLVPSTGVLLHSLAMELHAAFDTPALSPPEEAKLDRDPYGAFSRFLRQLERHRGETRFIVTLDEFETLEHRIREGKLQDDLIEYLRGVIVTQSWLTRRGQADPGARLDELTPRPYLLSLALASRLRLTPASMASSASRR